MITPLGQRQIFQTANIESVRAAHEVSELIQREQARQKAAEEHAAEEEAEVHGIAGSDRIRTEERRGGRNQGGSEEGASGEEEGQDSKDSAGPADLHLDFMA